MMAEEMPEEDMGMLEEIDDDMLIKEMQKRGLQMPAEDEEEMSEEDEDEDMLD